MCNDIWQLIGITLAGATTIFVVMVFFYAIKALREDEDAA